MRRILFKASKKAWTVSFSFQPIRRQVYKHLIENCESYIWVIFLCSSSFVIWWVINIVRQNGVFTKHLKFWTIPNRDDFSIGTNPCSKWDKMGQLIFNLFCAHKIRLARKFPGKRKRRPKFGLKNDRKNISNKVSPKYKRM